MIQFDLTDDLAQFGERLALLSEKNIRFAIAGAMTQAGKVAQRDLQEAMPRFIDRPNRWTMGSTFVQYAKAADLAVEVGIRGQDRSGRTGAAKYLAPLIEGGPPRPKGADLSASKLAGVRGVLTPVAGGPVRLDQYGNVSLSNYAKVLSAARTPRSGVFIGKLNPSGSVKGIFRRNENFIARTNTVQRNVRLLFAIDASPKRRTPQLPLHSILETSFRRELPSAIQTSLERELARLLGAS